MDVPVVGGHAGITILPLFSQVGVGFGRCVAARAWVWLWSPAILQIVGGGWAAAAVRHNGLALFMRIYLNNCRCAHVIHLAFICQTTSKFQLLSLRQKLFFPLLFVLKQQSKGATFV